MDQRPDRSFVNFIPDSPLTLVFSFGTMLLGYWLAKKEFFTFPAKFRSARITLILIGLLAGITASYLFLLVSTGKLELKPAFIWMPYMIVSGMLFQSLFYISAFISLYQTTWWRKVLSVFVPIGKMSLTNYLVQTILYLLVFFHWTNGFRLYGKISMSESYLIALLFFGLQVIFSYLWLKKHDQGPVEAAWKNLSYKFSGK